MQTLANHVDTAQNNLLVTCMEHNNDNIPWCGSIWGQRTIRRAQEGETSCNRCSQGVLHSIKPISQGSRSSRFMQSYLSASIPISCSPGSLPPPP